MKKLLLICVAIMCILVLLMTFSVEELGLVGEDGLAMPADSIVVEALRSGEGGWQKLTEVMGDEMIYETLTRYLVGDRRTAIDKEFPLFIRSGAALRFLSEENWLISTDVALLRTFEGMYLTDGYTYNSDMTQADLEEFILLRLPNGLFMNAQGAILTTRLETVEIPVNSILYFSEEALRWFYLEGDTLIYSHETALFDARITIGDHTYSYKDLLKALGLLSEAIEKLEENRDPEPELGQAEELLKEEEEKKDFSQNDGYGSGKDTADSNTPGISGGQGQTGGNAGGGSEGGDTGAGGDTGSGGSTGDTDGGEGNQKPGEGGSKPEGGSDPSKPGQDVPGETVPGETQPGQGPGDPDEDVPDETAPGETQPGENVPGETQPGDQEPDGTEPDETEPDETEPDETEPDETEPDETEPDETEPDETQPGETQPDETEPNETEPDETEPDIPSPPGGDPGQTVPGETIPGGEDPGQTDPRDPIYVEPEVTLTELEPWCYAIKGKLTVTDPASTVIRGVRISVFRDVRNTNSKVDPEVNEEGITVYPSEGFEGKSAMMRKTYQGSQEFALSTISPETKVYIQFNYRYNAQVKVMEVNPETGLEEEVTKVVRKTAYSDLYEISTTSSDGIYPVKADFQEVFAAGDQQFQLENLTLRNTTDYNPAPETFSFENFKKNILPYVNRLDFVLTDKDGKETTLSTSSNVIQNALTEQGALFTSARGQLKADTRYTYTVKAMDRYGNEIPLQLGDGFTGILFTQKTTPTVTIEEVENITDKLTLKVTVNDPSDALKKTEGAAEDLVLQILNTNNGSPALLYGTWEDDSRFGSENMADQTTTLRLTEPADGKSYTFTVESLAFNQSYTVQVTGGYDLQPSVAEETDGRLEPVNNAVLGTLRVFTASLSSGNIQFSTQISDLKDTSVALDFTMTRNTTLEILPMVDAFRMTVTDPQGKDVQTVTLNMTDLNTIHYEYNDESRSVIVDPGTATTPKIELLGQPEQFAGKSLWNALLISAVQNEESGDLTYSSPVQLRISFPKDTLETSTRYTYRMESLVYKTGIEYYIDTSLTSSTFTTKKIQPKLTFTDFFIASDVAEFIGLKIYDPDGTIQNDGLVNVRLYQGNVLLNAQKVYAVRNADDATVNLRFDGIIAGAQYRVEFRIAAYNDAEGYASFQTDVLLNEEEFAYNFEGGSGLYGTLELQSLEYTSFENLSQEYLYYSPEEAAQLLEAKTWTNGAPSGGNPRYYRTNKIDVPDGATYIHLPEYRSTGSTTYAYFYDARGTIIKVAGKDNQMTSTAAEPLYRVPDGAETMRFLMYAPDSVDAIGLQVNYMTTEESGNLVADATVDQLLPNGYYLGEQWTDSTAYNQLDRIIPVTPGDLLWMPQFSTYVVHYNAQGQYMGLSTSHHNSIFVVPEDVYGLSIVYGYVTIANFNPEYFQLYRVGSAQAADGYNARIRVNVEDTQGYLATEVADPKVTVTLSRSDTIQQPIYSTLVSTQEIHLSQLSDDRWIADQVEALTTLAPDCSWQMVMTTDYRGAQVELDTLNFQTDARYETIACEGDLYKINRNPFGNFIVTSDFTITNVNLSRFYGTLDGNGHTITQTRPGYVMLWYNEPSAVIRNLVISVPANQPVDGGIVNVNRGLMENIIVRTEGPITVNGSTKSLIISGNYGTLRNFIVRLGGDVTSTSHYNGLVVCYNHNGGVIENGYIYGVGGAGYITPQIAGAPEYRTGMLYQNYHGAVTRNLYIRLDTWHPQQEQVSPEYSGVLAGNGLYGSVNNVYHVGDSYVAGSNGTKNYAVRSTSERFWGTHCNASNTNLWHITDTDYAAKQNVLMGTPDKLYDISWQKEMLGSAFDVEGSVSMGFYPRLNMPLVMQKHQEYLPLPVISDTVPELVSDGMAQGYTQANETGTILLRFQNANRVEIQDVTIEGLEVVNIPYQGASEEDGLYDVHVTVNGQEFLSTYTVTGFRYSTGAGSTPVSCNYTTKNIEFWKEVASASQWIDINDNMNWNYRLTNDIDFTGELSSSAQIDGKKNAFDQRNSFFGKIDGGMHSLRGLNLTGVTNGGVIYYLREGGALKNLIVEGMNLTISPYTTMAPSGFIRHTDAGSVIDNVHFRNCTMLGVGQMGMLAGYCQSTVTNCSIADSTLRTQSSGTILQAGMMIGYQIYGSLGSCYVSNVQLIADQASSVQCVGGLVGYTTNAEIRNCYAQGDMTVIGSSVGGIVGQMAVNPTLITENWVDMDMDVTGDGVGGIVAAEATAARTSRNLFTGDILTSGTTVHRIFGAETVLSNYRLNYAYEGQTISHSADMDINDATKLLSGEALATRVTWVDTMGFGSQWDYSQLESNLFPKVYRTDGSGLVWGQQDLPIPGATGEHTMEITEVRYSPDNREYFVNLRWQHPGYTTDQLLEMKEAGTLTILLDGMDLEQDASVLISQAASEENVSYLTIQNKYFTKALDSYKLTVAYDAQEITTLINYGQSVYHDVPDLATWNQLMQEGHGTTMENFRITGKILFGTQNGWGSTDQRNLKIGNLIGLGEGAGFYYLDFDGMTSGDPWIETVTGTIQNITFEGIEADFTKVTSAQTRSSTGLILNAGDVLDCTMKNITITAGSYSNTYLGFFSSVTNSVQRLKVDTLSLKTATSGTVGNYVAGVAASVGDGFYDITANNVYVYAFASYVGGLFGNCGTSATSNMLNGKCTLTNVRMDGHNFLSLLAYRCRALEDVQIQNCSIGVELTNAPNKVYCLNGVARLVYGDLRNITVKDSQFISGRPAHATNEYCATAVCYYTQWNARVENILVENCLIEGNNGVGGLFYRQIQACYYNCRLVDSTVRNTSTSTGTYHYVGGIIGRDNDNYYAPVQGRFNGCVIRNSTITGPYRVGGIIGYGTSIAVYNSYVADDVTITATTGYGAGGISGTATSMDIRGCAVGATVNGVEAVGGIVGLAESVSTSGIYIADSYVTGKITASSNYAGGIIGSISEKAGLDSSKLNGLMVSATVTTPGGKASLWANSNNLGNVSPGDADVRIWDQAVLQGQTAEAILAADLAAGTSSLLKPVSGQLISADSFRNPNYYDFFTQSGWDFSGLPTYMPYSALEGVQLPNTDEGILAPVGPANRDVTDVYASGPATVNIEKANAQLVTVNGTEYPLDENGVVTLHYDFTTDLVVDGQTFKATDLRRTVMTFGDYWYYIDGSSIYYGTGLQDPEKPTVSGLEGKTPIHMWQGNVLCTDGSIYLLNGGSTALEIKSMGEKLTALDAPVPIYQYYGQKEDATYTVEVYHDFSIYGGTKVLYQVFEKDGIRYTVSPQQNVAHDGVLISSYVSAMVPLKHYFALLSADGTIESYLSQWDNNKFSTTGIRHISNTMGYDKPIVLARYNDGTVAGLNYATGELLFTTATQSQNFMSFGLRQVRSLMSNFFSFGTGGETDSVTLSVPESTQPTQATEPEGPEIMPGEGTGSDEAQPGEGGTNLTGGKGQSGETGETLPGETAGLEGDTSGEGGTGIQEGTAGISGTGTGAQEGPAVSGEGDAEGKPVEDAAYSESETIPEELGTAIPESGAVYVPGAGVYVDGTLAIAGEDAQYVPGEGIYAEGKLVYAESLEPGEDREEKAGTASGGGTGAEDGSGYVPLVSPAVRAQQTVAAMGGSSLVFDPETGTYAQMDNQVLLEAQPVRAEEPEEPEEADQPEETQDKPGSSFLVNQGENRKLTDSDRSGFLFLAIFALAGGGILLVLYFKVFRKKR